MLVWSRQDAHHHPRPSEQTRLELASYFEAPPLDEPINPVSTASIVSALHIRSRPHYQLQNLLFISALAKDGLAYSIIKAYLSTVWHLHILHNLPEPRYIPLFRIPTVIKYFPLHSRYMSKQF
jgi:hypothetical protein